MEQALLPVGVAWGELTVLASGALYAVHERTSDPDDHLYTPGDDD